MNDTHVRPLSRLLLRLIPTLVAAGPYASLGEVAGVNVFAFRFAVLVCAALPMLITFRLGCRIDRPARGYLWLGIIWVVWATASVQWSPDRASAMNETLVIAFGFLAGVALLNLNANSAAGARYLLEGWVLAFVFAALVAAWEITGGRHLPGYWVDVQPDYALAFVAISTFGNPNNYGAFLLLAAPFLLHFSQHATRSAHRLGATGFLLIGIALSALTTSRLSVVGMVLLVAVYFMQGARRRAGAIGVLATLTAAGIAGFVYLLRNVPVLLELVSQAQGGFALIGTDRVRMNLARAGLDMFVQSRGLGVGGGGFAFLMERGYGAYFTAGIAEPHNWWIEILSQYGIVVFVGFLALLVGFAAMRGARGPGIPGVASPQLLRTCIAGYVLAGLANSTYVAESTNWLYLATLMILASVVRATRGEWIAERPIADPDRQEPSITVR